MAVTMSDVRAALDPDEPEYREAAKLGPEALPSLEILVNSGDPMLASKAAYLASLIEDPKSEGVVRTAAQSADPALRVAAAAAAVNFPASRASNVLIDLVGDADRGVRKVARGAVPEKPTAELTKRLEELGDEAATLEAAPELPGGPVSTGPMPGEAEGGMPGEAAGRMPGEQSKMPGE